MSKSNQDEEFFDITNDLIVNIKLEGGKKTMGKKVILKTEIPREKNKLYYCGTDTKGNLTIGVVDMVRGKKKKKAVKKKKK